MIMQGQYEFCQTSIYLLIHMDYQVRLKRMITQLIFLLTRGLFFISSTAILFILYWGRPKTGDGAFHIPFFILINFLGILLWVFIEKRYLEKFNSFSITFQMLLSVVLVLFSMACILWARKLDHSVFMGFSFLFLLFKD